MSRVKMPSVITSMRVFARTFEPKRTASPPSRRRFPSRSKHPLGRGAGGEPARLQHQDFLVRGPKRIDQPQRHARVLPAPAARPARRHAAAAAPRSGGAALRRSQRGVEQAHRRNLCRHRPRSGRSSNHQSFNEFYSATTGCPAGVYPRLGRGHNTRNIPTQSPLSLDRRRFHR